MQLDGRQEQLGAGPVPLDVGPRCPPLPRLTVPQPLTIGQLSTGLLAVVRENLAAFVKIALDGHGDSGRLGVGPHLFLQRPNLVGGFAQQRVYRGDVGGELAVVGSPLGARPEPEDPRSAPLPVLVGLDPAPALVLLRPQCTVQLIVTRA